MSDSTSYFRILRSTRNYIARSRAKAECVLVEIKCPLRRWPKNTIPPQYEPQVLGGLIATDEVTQRGLLIDAVFKICTKDQLGEGPGYNTAFHKDSVWMRSRHPLAWGEIQRKMTSLNKCWMQSTGEIYPPHW